MVEISSFLATIFFSSPYRFRDPPPSPSPLPPLPTYSLLPPPLPTPPSLADFPPTSPPFACSLCPPPFPPPYGAIYIGSSTTAYHFSLPLYIPPPSSGDLQRWGCQLASQLVHNKPAETGIIYLDGSFSQSATNISGSVAILTFNHVTEVFCFPTPVSSSRDAEFWALYSTLTLLLPRSHNLPPFIILSDCQPLVTFCN